MQVAIITFGHAELLQHIHQLFGASAGVDRRIVQEGDLAGRVPRRLQAHPQAASLPRHQLFALSCHIVKGPAAGAAEGGIAQNTGVVVQDVERVKAGIRQVLFHLAGGGPPVVVVTFQQPFLARQTLDIGEVRLGIAEVHRPAGVPRQHHGILGADEFAPVGFEFGQIPLPAGKNIHGFICP